MKYVYKAYKNNMEFYSQVKFFFTNLRILKLSDIV